MEQVFSYKVEHFTGKTKRYCQTLKLKNDGEGIKKNVELHSKEKHWKEIRDGIREVGILDDEKTPADLRLRASRRTLSGGPVLPRYLPEYLPKTRIRIIIARNIMIPPTVNQDLTDDTNLCQLRCR